jgi:isoleucyl-tRNA synthetase
MSKYNKLESDPKVREATVSEFWNAQKTFEKSLEKNRNKPSYVWYDGPPTANGLPHFGHLIPRIYKDFFPRYKTMRGFYAPRKGGWDTHGLPVEIEVEKSLGINSKQQIEEYGVEKFIEKCKESVWKYIGEWEDMARRMAFWYDMKNAYVSYHDQYIETGWWALKKFWEEDLLYQGYKVLPYCPRCGTSLSSHEVAQGYEEVSDPSVFVKMKLRERENEYVIAWTTTPWTLPGNVALAVGPDFVYAKVKQGDEIYYLANDLLGRVLDGEYEVLETLKGSQMEGWEYEPLFPYLKEALEKRGEKPKAWYVTSKTGEMVTTEDGSGVVHTAVMYGEEDYELGQRLGLPKLHTVDQAGKFISEVKPWAGIFVKDADKQIIRHLKETGKLFKSTTVRHNYPFCWRCQTPLIYYALESWFIRSTARQTEIIANNKKIAWHPEHMQEGRFGNFLETMKDWALSRNRYWGTPLPVWACKAGHQVCVGSRAQLVELAQDKKLAQSVELHRPYIDNVKLTCPECGEAMQRAPYVLDCWFDSGMMHTAQWHMPFENERVWEQQFPADFICEGMDQTRGWFYTLLVTSTLLYPDKEFPHPYRHVLVTGMGLDDKGKKMSKSRGNVLPPMELVDQFGADALRWYLFAGTAPWRDRVLTADDVGKTLHSFINTIVNVYNFFALYGAIDGFEYEKQNHPLAKRTLLDRWMISRFHHAAKTTTESLDNYDIISATNAIESLVEELSNWYVRVSRPRFWGNELSADKKGAYSTLYEVLVGLSKVLTPFMPFLAESLYQALGAPEEESAHLCEYPVGDSSLVDNELEAEMELAQKIVSLGRSARQNSGFKVRQPLQKITVQHERTSLPNEISSLAKSELNVKELLFTNENLRVKNRKLSLEPDMTVLGPKFGPLAPQIKKALSDSSIWADIAGAIESKGNYSLKLKDQNVDLAATDVKIKYTALEKSPVAFDETCFVMLDTEITPELRSEGIVRELVHHIQQFRKEADFEVADRIELFFECERELEEVIHAYADEIKKETLATRIETRNLSEDDVHYVGSATVNGLKVKIGLKRKGP